MTNYSGRASELGGIVNLTDRRRSSLTNSERPSLITHFDDRLIVAKLSKSRVWGKVPERSRPTLIFGDIRIPLQHSVEQVENVPKPARFVHLFR